MDLRAHLRTEFDRRRARNPRYSLRAYARHLGTDHSALSRILNANARLTPRRISTLGPRLGLSRRAVASACLHENMLLVADLTDRPDFRADARWIATHTGLPIDDVNVALHYLVYEKKLTLTSTTKWTRTPNR